MDTFKKDYDTIVQKKRELSQQNTTAIRKAIISALGAERRAVRLLDESTGESFHVRLDERETKCAPSLSLIVKALEAMEAPTATDFMQRLEESCVKRTKSLKLTKTTRVDAVGPKTSELKDLCLGFRAANVRRSIIRKELKDLRASFEPQERRMASALAAAGIDREEAKDENGTPFFVCRKITRKRKRVPKSAVFGKVEEVFQLIKSEGRHLSTEQMAAMIYEAINPVHEEACVVVK